MVLADSYQVTSALTGEQGIEIVRDENPDVVLLDINLPDLDGLEVLKRIMAIPAPPAVLMLTVYLIYNDLDKSDCTDFRRRCQPQSKSVAYFDNFLEEVFLLL